MTSEKPLKHRPIQTIDWRAELCNLLNLDTAVGDNDILDAKGSAAELLEKARNVDQTLPATLDLRRCEIIYSVYCYDTGSRGFYFDEPWVVEGGKYNAHLRGSNVVSNLDLHLERNKDITFIVYRKLECCGGPGHDSSDHQDDLELPGSYSSKFFRSEYIHVVSDELSEGLEELADEALNNIPYPSFDKDFETTDIAYPYLWWFHRREEIKDAIETLSPECQSHLDVFKHYIEGQLKNEWEAVDSLFADHRITAEYLQYLFIPDGILISKAAGSKLHQLRGVTALDWLDVINRSGSDYSATIRVGSWNFQGGFSRLEEEFDIDELPEAGDDESFLIEDLSIYPMEHANLETVDALRSRGKMFWKCRHRNYVSSSRFSDGIQPSIDSRFMVDYRTYQQIHPDQSSDIEVDDIGPEIMAKDDPLLEDDFFMCLPTTIPGFNMQKKEWVKLDVAFIEDVTWNHRAFEHLVIDDDTKELVKAVVTTKLRADENTDLILGKGNGLFILLHGGPGTGKTLTAESVAEIAEKPLYRVTCGDIGTKAEDVEKVDKKPLLGVTLISIVVLLDEADVFLEERTLQSLERNALVSVFLRVLEYYDGILILTSNRVGTFDEAFKSRIQLNLRYQNLDEAKRVKIWHTFIDRIESLESKQCSDGEIDDKECVMRQNSGINAAEIRSKIPELAKTNLNGREIRNAISTARQLALHRKQPLGYAHVDRVIREAKKFDEYLKEIHQGYTADDIRRGRGER
ncbi:AAA family ATPase [Colletotrichum truncatum]|uniref:AAA family ATPase n=1 Tax=Colletotrichum truncatum TaxID=5467 RepID=A0ACC3Z059_COLTU